MNYYELLEEIKEFLIYELDTTIYVQKHLKIKKLIDKIEKFQEEYDETKKHYCKIK